MRHSRLLELIWQGDVRLATGLEASRMQRALNALLPLRTICLAVDCGVDRSLVLNDDTELLPEVLLGDVLAEELLIDVPAGSLVVLRDAQLLSGETPAEERSYDLGGLVAEALLGVLRSEVFPLTRETSALYTMASSYCELIQGSGFLQLGLIPDQFRAGLAAELCSYWTGAQTARSDTSGLSLEPGFLTSPRLLGYLEQLDGNFAAPDRIPAGLMLFAGGPCDYNTWLFRVRDAVTGRLDAHATRTCAGGKQKEQHLLFSRKN